MINGFGIGLRSEHYPYLESGGDTSGVDWFEAITENYLDTEGRPFGILERIRSRFPVALHGVSLSIGSSDPVSPRYLRRLKKLVRRIEPGIVSDHLCWSGVGGEELHDLLPLPFTQEAVRRCVEKILTVQDAIGRPMLIENVSSYITYRHSEMSEWDFLVETARRAGAKILLDLNNIYVNARNHGFDPHRYVAAIPAGLVGQFHLAGYTDYGDFLFDTHNAEVSDPVWRLYADAVERFEGVPTLFEWDEKIPEFRELVRNLSHAREVAAAGPGGARIPETAGSAKRPDSDSPKPLSLKRVQYLMRESIRLQEPAGELRLITRGGEENRLDRRFSVYISGYRARVGSAVLENFAAVKFWAGEDLFGAWSTAYANAVPSRTYNLSRAADDFPEFLSGAEGVRCVPFIVDLAKFERELSKSFHAARKDRLEPQEFGRAVAEHPEALRIRFQPHARLFASDWPVLELWQEAKKSAPAPVPSAVLAKKARVLIFRRGEEVYFRPLGEAEFEFLNSLWRGKTLGESCEAAQAASGDQTPDVGGWMAQMMAEELLWCPRHSVLDRAGFASRKIKTAV